MDQADYFTTCSAKVLNCGKTQANQDPYQYKIASDYSYIDIFLESTWSYYNLILTSIGTVNINLIPWYDPDE